MTTKLNKYVHFYFQNYFFLFLFYFLIKLIYLFNDSVTHALAPNKFAPQTSNNIFIKSQCNNFLLFAYLHSCLTIQHFLSRWTDTIHANIRKIYIHAHEII